MVTSREFEGRLRRRARKVSVAVSGDLAGSLYEYFRLLFVWNRKINLTSLPLESAPDDTIDRLIVEPLVAARHLASSDGTIVDLGSGGGSPAIPLKLACSTTALRMVEAKARKAAFLREAVRHLRLTRVEVETARFEELLARPELHEAADVVTLRAVRVEPRLLAAVQAFLKPMGQIFLFRGASGPDVPAVLAPPLVWLATHPLTDATRNRLVVLRKESVGIERKPGA